MKPPGGGRRRLNCAGGSHAASSLCTRAEESTGVSEPCGMRRAWRDPCQIDLDRAPASPVFRNRHHREWLRGPVPVVKEKAQVSVALVRTVENQRAEQTAQARN